MTSLRCTLPYHVTKKQTEIEDLQLDKENVSPPFAAIDIINIDDEFSPVTLDSSFNNSSQSVLSVLSSSNVASLSTATSSLSSKTTKSKPSRKNARQASAERLNRKLLNSS